MPKHIGRPMSGLLVSISTQSCNIIIPLFNILKWGVCYFCSTSSSKWTKKFLIPIRVTNTKKHNLNVENHAIFVEGFFPIHKEFHAWALTPASILILTRYRLVHQVLDSTKISGNFWIKYPPLHFFKYIRVCADLNLIYFIVWWKFTNLQILLSPEKSFIFHISYLTIFRRN